MDQNYHNVLVAQDSSTKFRSGSLKALFIYLSTQKNEYLLKTLWPIHIKSVPKLGLQYLCAVLEGADVDADVEDQSIVPFDSSDLLEKLRNHDYLFVGFYTSYSLKDKVIEYIRSIKGSFPNFPIIIGGPGYFLYEDYLNAGADFVIHGEAERTIILLVEHFLGKRSVEDITGVSYRRDGRCVKAVPQSLIVNLDDLPFPKRDKKMINKYYDFQYFALDRPYVSMITSRGCPFCCSFCSSPNVMGQNLRLRSPANVVKEIEYCKKEFGIRSIGFKDDVFGIRHDWLEEFCLLMIKHDFGIHWVCMMYVTTLKSLEILERMSQAGCRAIVAGVQSSDKTVLKQIHRSDIDKDYLVTFCRKAKKENIQTKLQFIFGLPGDSDVTYDLNTRLVREAKPNFAFFYSYVKLEGSDLYHQDNSKQEKEVKKKLFYAYLTFYTNPVVIFQNISYIIRNNPKWFFIGPPRIFCYLLRVIILKCKSCLHIDGQKKQIP